MTRLTSILFFIFFVSVGLKAEAMVPPDTASGDRETLRKNAILPFMFYSDETSLAVGVMDQYVHQPWYSKKASSILAFGFYTLKKQYLLELKPEIYIRNDTYKFSGEMEYRFWPTLFYGFGNGTKQIPEEEYTSRELNIDLTAEKAFTSRLYLGVHFLLGHHSISEFEAEGILETTAPDGVAGGTFPGVGLSASWDSRNDNIFPESGGYHQLKMNYYGSSLGSDYDFQSYLADLRYYVSILPGHVIAIQSVTWQYNDEVPFQVMKTVGDYLRGYQENKILGKNLHAFQLEYRSPMFRRMGIIGFAGAGQVSEHPDGLSIRQYNLTSGFGFRVALIPEKKLNLRFDIGFGENDMTVDMDIMEAF